MGYNKIAVKSYSASCVEPLTLLFQRLACCFFAEYTRFVETMAFCRHIISDGLRKTHDNPDACGVFANVWRGALRDEKVCQSFEKV